MSKLNKLVFVFAFLLYGILAVAQTHSLSAGWNLVGNDAGADIDPVAIFGNATSPTSVSSSIATVWSWDSTNSRWNFFAPSMTATSLSTYANSKGYGALSKIVKGEGFWVNAASQVTLNLVATSSSSGFPMTFNGIRMDSMTFSTDTIGCNATLTYKNISTTASTPYLYFDILVGGITVNQTIFYS